MVAIHAVAVPEGGKREAKMPSGMPLTDRLAEVIDIARAKKLPRAEAGCQARLAKVHLEEGRRLAAEGQRTSADMHYEEAARYSLGAAFKAKACGWREKEVEAAKIHLEASALLRDSILAEQRMAYHGISREAAREIFERVRGELKEHAAL